MTEKKVVSPRFSLQGWNFKDWLLGNGKTIKEIAKVLIPAALTWLETNSPEWTVVGTLFGKLILDTLEYYIKEKTA